MRDARPIALSAIDLVLAGDVDAAAALLLDALDDAFDLGGALSAAAKDRWPDLSDDIRQLWADIADSSDLVDILYGVGAAAWASHEHETAVLSFHAGALRGDVDSALAFGEAQLWLKNPDAAEPALEQVIANDTRKGAIAAGLLGAYYFETVGRTDDQVRGWLEAASKVDDRYPILLAKLWIKRGEAGDALRILRAESEAGNKLAPVVLGDLLDSLGRRSEAAVAYQRGIKLGDETAAVRLANLERSR